MQCKEAKTVFGTFCLYLLLLSLTTSLVLVIPALHLKSPSCSLFPSPSLMFYYSSLDVCFPLSANCSFLDLCILQVLHVKYKNPLGSIYDWKHGVFVFLVWVFLVTMMFYSSIYLPSNFIFYFLYIVQYFIICPQVNGHLGYFHVLAIMNRVAVIKVEPLDLGSRIPGLWSRITGKKSFLAFLEVSTLISIVAIPVYITVSV